MFRLIHDIRADTRSRRGMRLHDGQPFVRHAFLAALESSGSVGPASWPGYRAHATLWEGEMSCVAAAPLYLQVPLLGRIRVRTGPGPGKPMQRHGQALLPQVAMRRALHAGARARACWRAMKTRAKHCCKPCSRISRASAYSSFHILSFPQQKCRGPANGRNLMQRQWRPVSLAQPRVTRHFEDFL